MGYGRGMCLDERLRASRTRPSAVVPYRKLGDDFTHFIIVDFHRGIFRAGQREEIGM